MIVAGGPRDASLLFFLLEQKGCTRFEYIPSFFVIDAQTPMHEVVPSVVRMAVMMLAIICKIVFQPSFFMILFDF